MSKYGDADWRLREAIELQNRRGVTYLYSNGGEVMYCSIRDGECPRPGPGFPWFWRCACRGARCCFGGGGRGGDAPPPTYGGRSHFQSIQTEVATSEAGTVVSASRFPKGTDSDTGFHPPATISSGERTAKEACCDAPGDITCKTSGMPHNAICTVCHMVMKKKQPFCSKRTGGALCSAGRVGPTPPPSPFKKVEGSKEYGDCPPPKVMKFDDADNKGTPEG